MLIWIVEYISILKFSYILNFKFSLYMNKECKVVDLNRIRVLRLIFF